MSADKLQLQRLEFKYLVKEPVALAMREFVSSYLVLDENCIDKPNNSYLNHSIYLDSPRLRCYWDVLNGVKNRYKLRMRFYDDEPTSPVFFEIKRRVDNAILKQRGGVFRHAVPSLLAGQLPDPGDLVSTSAKQRIALERFHELMVHNQAAPKTHVAYLREAWVSERDNSVRVTFDRDVWSAPHFDSVISTKMNGGVQPWGDLVILELKFTGRFPEWFKEMVRIFQVMQCGVAKYAEGIALLDEQHQLSPPMTEVVHSPQTQVFQERRAGPRERAEGAGSAEEENSPVLVASGPPMAAGWR